MQDVTQLILDRTNDHTKAMNYLFAHKDRMEHLLDKLNEAGVEIQHFAGNWYGFSVSITGNKQVLNRAWGVFRKCKLVTEDFVDEAAPYISAYFTVEPVDGEVSVYTENAPEPFKVELCFSSTVCKRVKVGSKKEVVDVAIYETRCDE